MSVGEVYKLTAIWNRAPSTRVIVNEFYFRQDSALILDTPPEDLVAAFQADVEALYAALVTDFLTLIHYKVALVPDNDTIYEQFVTVPGGSTGDPLPAYMSLFVRTRTANFTRTGRGGLYLPPTVESANTNGIPNSGYINPVGDLADAIIDDMSEGGLIHADWTWGVYSKTDEAFYPITVYSVPPRWSHQRDRRSAY